MGRPAIPVQLKGCRQCGLTMERKRYGATLEDRTAYSKRAFCDQQCMAIWQEGRIRVASDKAGRRQSVKARKSVCERCSSTRALHVHHKDENPRNNSVLNLQTLCASCHRLSHSLHFDPTTGQRKPCMHCARPAIRRGLCWTHLTRSKKYGDPLVTKVKEGSSWVLKRTG